MPSSGELQALENLRETLHTDIERGSPIPLYVQLKEILCEAIESGLWRPGERIPSEPELCEAFGVSRTVVRQALKELAFEGLVVREQGKGTFVAEPKISEGLVQKLTGFYQDMVERGHRVQTMVMRQEVLPASHRVADRLRLKPGDPVIRIDRLRSVNEEPIVFVTTYLPYHLCPSLLQADLSAQSLYAFLERECGLRLGRGRRTIEAVPASEYEAKLLQVEKGAPLILLDSVSYLDGGTPIEYYRALHRGDRSRFEVDLIRVRRAGPAVYIEEGVLAELPHGNDLIDDALAGEAKS